MATKAATNLSAGGSQPKPQGVIRVSISLSRKITIPAQLRRVPPYYLVEVSPDLTDSVGQWLAILEAESLAEVGTEFAPLLQVLTESTGYELALPAAVCEKYGLNPGCLIWLIAVGDYLEVWSESALRAEEKRSFDALVFHDFVNSIHPE